MLQTPKGLRLHIVLLGRVNAGKSSFLNLITGQQTSITSAVWGTTTDVVEKAQELLPIGPVLWLDTAGFGDNTALAAQRMEKTKRVLDRADVAVLVLEGDTFGAPEQEIIRELEKRKLPYIKVYNKADLSIPLHPEGLVVNALDLSRRDEVLTKLTAMLLKICPDSFLTPEALLSDLLPSGGTVVMIVPIDYEAPKGRLILPQVQAIRDCLDHDQNVLIVKENAYLQALDNMKKAPDLVVCDSQVVRQMVQETPPNIKCTTFSILMARLKGDLMKMVEGSGAIWKLKNGDKVLIAESCTHHAVDDDIGTVKIPSLLRQKTGKNLFIEHVSGCDFAQDLSLYKLIVQCGGCTQNRRQILSRIEQCLAAGVPITNYGLCLSALNGVLERVLEPFPDVLERYQKLKNDRTSEN